MRQVLRECQSVGLGLRPHDVTHVALMIPIPGKQGDPAEVFPVDVHRGGAKAAQESTAQLVPPRRYGERPSDGPHLCCSEPFSSLRSQLLGLHQAAWFALLSRMRDQLQFQAGWSQRVPVCSTSMTSWLTSTRVVVQTALQWRRWCRADGGSWVSWRTSSTTDRSRPTDRRVARLIKSRSCRIDMRQRRPVSGTYDSAARESICRSAECADWHQDQQPSREATAMPSVCVSVTVSVS